MARQYKKQSSVSGLSISQILKMPESKFRQYSESDQRKIVGRLVSAGNKRLRTFEKYDVESPTVIDVIESGGKFSTRGKDEAGLLKELTRARAFLKSPTSTLSGWRKIENKMHEGLQKRGYDVKIENLNVIANMLGKLSRERSLTSDERYKIMEKINYMLNEQGQQNADDLIKAIERDLDNIYRSTQEDFLNATASDFFPVK